MNGATRDDLLKGLFLGLWLYLALLAPPAGVLGRVLLAGGVGLVLALVVGAAWQLRRGVRVAGNPVGFLLLVLLESSYFVAIGLVGGVALAVALLTDPPEGQRWPLYAVLGGAALGVGFSQLRLVRPRLNRVLLSAVVGAALVYLGTEYLPGVLGDGDTRQSALVLLAGLPFFYLLVFSSETEETEVEIACLCAALGVSLYQLRLRSSLGEQFDKLVFLLPAALYYVYTTYVLRDLTVFKHTLRGYAYLSARRPDTAAAFFARAVQLAPGHTLANQGLRKLLAGLDYDKLPDSTAVLLPPEVCLAVAEEALLGHAPSPKAVETAGRLLDLVARHRPEWLPRTEYLRAVAQTHAGHYDLAAATLSKLLDPADWPESQAESRRRALFPAWQLALGQHPELAGRLGETELNKPGRRVGAIQATESQLRLDPADADAVHLKRGLYAGLSEPEYLAAAGEGGAPAGLDADYLEQLGQSVLAHQAGDPAQLERGLAYLRMAARGDPARGFVLFEQLATRADELGRPDEATGYRGQIRRLGATIGPANLTAEQRRQYLAALEQLVEGAIKGRDFASAVDDQRLLIEAGVNGTEAYRRLATLYAELGDPLNAALVAERGLLGAKADADLLEKRASYYYSIPLDRAAAAQKQVAPWFDVAYCVAQAGRIADQSEADAETLDYGLHLARLARAVAPTSQAAMLAEARLLLRRGDRDGGLKLLEDLREQPRGSGADEDAWFLAARTLGRMYLDELGRPDLAVGCFQDYRQSPKSGADTLYQLGRACEATGDTARALKCYEVVATFTGHPLYFEATEAVRRLKAGR